MSPDSKKKLKATAIPTIFTHIPGKRRTPRDPSNWQTSKYRKMDIEQILTESPEPEVNSVEMDSHHEPPQTPVMQEVGLQTDFLILPPLSHGKKTRLNRGTQTDVMMCTVSTQYEESDFADEIILLDHAYSTPFRTPEKLKPPKQTSTPFRGHSPFRMPQIPRCIDSTDISLHESSFDSLQTSRNETDDSIFSPESSLFSSDGSIDSDSSCENTLDTTKAPQEEKKYIVFESQLAQLFSRCQECGDRVLHMSSNSKGSQLKVTTTCASNHIYEWHSQPIISKMAAGTLLFSASILFTGCTFTQLKTLADCMNLQLFSEKTYCKIQDSVLFPVIHEEWKSLQLANIQEVKEEPVWLAGDGLCDSPGFNAKYCTYTMMDKKTNRILDFALIHVAEAKYSVNMEKLGFERCLSNLQGKLNTLEVIATDRHFQITAAMKRDHSDLTHQFDIWHIAKWLTKKLAAAAKHKGCDTLAPWTQSIVNWFWFCTASCDGDAELLKEKWISILHHIANVHEWSSGEKFHRCTHPPVSHRHTLNFR